MIELIKKHQEELNVLLDEVKADAADAKVAGLSLGNAELEAALRKLAEKSKKIRVEIQKIPSEDEKKLLEESRVGLLKQYSDLIQSAFAPKTEAHDGKSRGEVELDEPAQEDQEQLEIEGDDFENESYRDFNNQIKSYKDLQLAIERIRVGEYENRQQKTMEIIEVLNQHLDLLKEAGLQTNFKIEVKKIDGKVLDKPIFVDENNVFLIKDVLDLLVRNEQIRNRDELKRPIQIVCGKFQVDEATVETALNKGKNGVRKLLLDQIKKTLPNLLEIDENSDLLDKSTSLAKQKEKDWKKALGLMELDGQLLYSRLSVEAETAVEEIEKIDNPTKEQQLQQFASLQQKTQPIFDTVDQQRGEYSKQRNTILEATKIINGYELHLSKLEGSIIAQVLMRSRVEKLKKNTAITLSQLLGRQISADDLDNLNQLKKDLSEQNLAIEPHLIMFDVVKKRLKSKLDELANEKGIDSYFRDIEARGLKEGIGSLSDEEIMMYILTYEVAFWTNLHVDSDHEFQKQLVLFVKYQWHGEGKGWENQASKDGTEDDEWASMEGRTVMGLLKAFGLYAKVLTGDPHAEGKKEDLFTALTDLRFTRESLLQITSHPHYGPFLTKILEIYQDLPSLRAGKLPDQDILLDQNRLRANMTDKEFNVFLPRLERHLNADGSLKEDWQKNLLLNERLVWRNMLDEDGQPTRKLIKLAADRFVKNTKGEWSFYPGEETDQSTDTLYLNADARFNYVTLAGSMGKKTRNQLIDVIIEMIKSNPEQYELKKSNIPKKEFNMFAAKTFAQFFSYSIPFLTKIYAEATMQTQTAAHPTDAGEINFYDLFSGLLGKAIQNLERYGVIDTLVWIFPYYKPFKDGIFGASGKAGRINSIQKLMVSFIEYLFGDASKKIVHRIDPNDPRRPDMFTPMDMVARGKNEQVRYHAPITTEDGKIIQDGSSSSPAKIGEPTDKPVEVYDWPLFKLSVQAIRKARELAIGEIKPGSVTMESITTEDLNPFTKLIAKIVGQLKMFDLGDKIKYINPFLFHGSGRLSYAIKKDYNPHTVHRAFTNFLNKAIGNPIEEAGGQGPKMVVSRGVGGGSPIEESMQELIDDMNGEGEQFPFRDGHEEEDLVEDIISGISVGTRQIFTNNAPVAEEEPAKISSLFQKATVHISTRRYKILVGYLEELWGFWATEYYSRVKDLKSSWPFKDSFLANKFIIQKLPELLSEKHEVYQTLVNNFIKILVGEKEVIPPFGRPNFEKD